MACNCEVLQKKLEKLQKKYLALRKNHRKLLGVSALITGALEEFIKGDVRTEINDTLKSCLAIYPDLFQNEKSLHDAVDNKNLENDINFIENKDEADLKVCEPYTESEREYYQGFRSRPRIPRTPQN